MEKKNKKAESKTRAKSGKPARKGKGKKGYSGWSKFIITLNILALICLLLSYSASYISPEKVPLLAFFGLFYPLILCINLAFVIYWMINRRAFVFIPLVLIALGFNHITAIIQFDINKNTPSNPDRLVKVMSYNVRLFDLYNWTRNEESRNLIFNILKEESGDIICLQEFYTKDEGKLQNTDTISKLQKSFASHIEYTATVKKTRHWGIATFSRYPILKKGVIRFSEKTDNICIFTDIKIKKDTIRVYNAHLESVHFGKQEHKVIDDLNQYKAEKENFPGIKKISVMLKKGYIKRSSQADLIQESISKSPYPVILCGDLNDTPSSYTYHTVSKNLNDAFVESGSGLGSTYYSIFPSFRIDYILYSPVLTSYKFKTIHKKYSDHYPITCYIELPEKKKE